MPLGVTRREIERAVRAGDLVRVRRNALVDGPAWREAAPWQRHEARARAVAASLDPEGAAVLTHHSALAIHGVALHGVDERVHLARTDGTRGRTDRVLASHRPMEAFFAEVHDGIRVVRPEVACLQVAAQFGAESGLVSADDALHRRVVSVDSLRQTLDELAPGRSSRAPRAVVDLADPRIESAAESRARGAFHVAGLPQPTPRVVVVDEWGALFARVDFLIEELGVVIEVDGMGKYGDRSDLRAEKIREDRLRELGHEVVRLVWTELSDPRIVHRKVMAAVARARCRRAA